MARPRTLATRRGLTTGGIILPGRSPLLGVQRLHEASPSIEAERGALVAVEDRRWEREVRPESCRIRCPELQHAVGEHLEREPTEPRVARHVASGRGSIAVVELRGAVSFERRLPDFVLLTVLARREEEAAVIV